MTTAGCDECNRGKRDWGAPHIANEAGAADREQGAQPLLCRRSQGLKDRRSDRDLALCDPLRQAQPCENPYLTVLPWLKPWLTLRMAPPRVLSG